MFENSKGFFCKTMILIIIAGMAIRLILGTLLTYNYDVFSWALIISNIQAGSELYDVTGYNYPPVWGYFLAIVGEFTDLLGMDVLAERFPDLIFTESEVANNPHLAFTTTVEFNALMAFVMGIFDIFTSYTIYYVSKEIFKDERKGLIGAAIWMLCPFAIIVGAVGSMFDCLSGALALVCVALLMKDKEFLAGMVLAIAVFLKFFPGFLLFIFVAYVIVKHRDDYKQRVMMAVLGACIISAIIMLPHVLDGHLMDSFSFLISRAEVSNGPFGILERIGPIMFYALAIIFEIWLARRFIRKEHEDLDKDFMIYTFIATMTTLMYPGTPQYVLFGGPLLVLIAVCVNERFKLPLIILMFGTSLFVLCSSTAEMTSLMEYTDLLSFDTWFGMNSWMMNTTILGLNMFIVLSDIGAIIQYLALLIAFILIVKIFIYHNQESQLNGLYR